MPSLLAIPIPRLRESAERKKIRRMSPIMHFVRGEMRFVLET
jgi:hypothetical protein